MVPAAPYDFFNAGGIARGIRINTESLYLLINHLHNRPQRGLSKYQAGLRAYE
jgi:hypothetical protein